MRVFMIVRPLYDIAAADAKRPQVSSMQAVAHLRKIFAPSQ